MNQNNAIEVYKTLLFLITIFGNPYKHQQFNEAAKAATI